MSEIPADNRAVAAQSPVVWVVAVALVAGDGKILLQRRRRDRTYGGLWEFPGGKLEPDESPEMAAIREMGEELGVRLDPSALQAVSFASGAASSGAPLVILLYACRQWQGDPCCLDAEEMGWFAPEQLQFLAMPPLDYPLAQALIGALSKLI